MKINIIGTYRILYHNGINQIKNLISHDDYLNFIKTNKVKMENYFTDKSPLYDAIKDARLVLPPQQGGVHLCLIQPLDDYKENKEYVEYSANDLHSFSDMGRYVCVVTAKNIFKELDKLYIDEIIEVRRIIREQKHWFLSDIVRSYLDEKYVFVFDTKDGQEIYNLNKNYFKNKEKIEKLHNIKFRINRDFVEFKIKQDIQAEKSFESWLYSTQASIKK